MGRTTVFISRCALALLAVVMPAQGTSSVQDIAAEALTAPLEKPVILLVAQAAVGPIRTDVPMPVPRPPDLGGKSTPAVDASAPPAELGLTPLPTFEAAAASSACLDPSTLTDGDGDFARNQVLWSAICVTEHAFTENGAPWIVHTIKPRNAAAGPLWATPHDNEDAAFDSGLYGVTTYGGTLVSVESNGQRNNGAIDPNRIFTGDRSLCGRQSPRYTELFLSHASAGQPIIALHTNDAGSTKTGGTGTISINAPFANSQAYKVAVTLQARSPEDSVVFVASTMPPGNDPVVDGLVAALNAANMNVLREHVTIGGNDCSLSNFAALNGLSRYFNIEVLHGDGEAQRRMIDAVMAIR